MVKSDGEQKNLRIDVQALIKTEYAIQNLNKFPHEYELEFVFVQQNKDMTEMLAESIVLSLDLQGVEIGPGPSLASVTATFAYFSVGESFTIDLPEIISLLPFTVSLFVDDVLIRSVNECRTCPITLVEKAQNKYAIHGLIRANNKRMLQSQYDGVGHRGSSFLLRILIEDTAGR